MAYGVTIGQAAAFAGVTVKTVRHYHKLGLLDEPPRDGSGYRRYGSDELLRLVQVRTLAAAGVPLAEVGVVLDADVERFGAALADVQRRLTEQIEELIARRETLHQLAEGDRALLPERALELLHRMSALGFEPDYVTTQREALVLSLALVPEGFDGFLTLLEHRLDDPGYVDLAKRCWEAENWQPDDPRVGELAAAVAEHFLANPTLLGNSGSLQAWFDSVPQHRVINYHRQDRMPVSARLTSLIETKLRSAGVSVPHQ
ncbi:DNA-binding transcriptional regulator, MerR family [Actinopolyspora mzabensis]|uniref:DNA-binding transcriptional regulator, MerR family n=1 Tax=Actinopolyspora mzabensis TaxID=995066 RepID=A0A1G8YA26_ACTMZ|nr:MerR family transcriptional regulator [Actinopolyspora mzabensis]SDJ99244.1 DNA-binding transcriptional regulator, MerR family [Actinopolyspora mzabensis]